jgi:hypothetical protein
MEFALQLTRVLYFPLPDFDGYQSIDLSFKFFNEYLVDPGNSSGLFRFFTFSFLVYDH